MIKTLNQKQALAKIETHCKECEKENCNGCTILELEESIAHPEVEIPTVKRRSRFKGVWKHHKCFSKYECSRCGNHTKRPTAYCNKCGAIMNIKTPIMSWD